jgi:hypothetical protein
MLKAAFGASEVRENIWQRVEGVCAKLDASRDRSACVWALDEQDTHAILLNLLEDASAPRIWRRKRLEMMLEKSIFAVITV